MPEENDEGRKIPIETDTPEASSEEEAVSGAIETEGRTPTEVVGDIKTEVDVTIDHLEEPIPEALRKEPKVEALVDELESKRSDLDANLDAVLSEEKSDTAESSRKMPVATEGVEVRADGIDVAKTMSEDFEGLYELLDKDKSMEKFPGEQQYIEALQGRLAENDLFGPVPFVYEKDGKTVTENGKSIYDFYQEDKGERLEALAKMKAGDDPELKKIGAEGLNERLTKFHAALDKLKEEHDKGTESKEAKEGSREGVIKNLETGVSEVQKMFDAMSDEEKVSPRGKEIAWILESVKSAKEGSVDKGETEAEVALLDGEGNPRKDAEGNPVTQKEGIPVEGIIKMLREKHEDRIDESLLSEDERKRLKQLREVIPEDEALSESGGVVPKNVDAYNEKNKAELADLLSKATETSRKEREFHEEVAKFLEENSKAYFDKHFGKEATALTEEEQKKQHLRTEHEAYLISTDHRATGSPDGDYALAMQTMEARRELVIPEKEKAPEPVPEVVPETPEPTPEPSPEPTPEPTPEPVPPTPEKPEDKEKTKEGTKPSLETLRNAYALAVNGRKKFFGRTSTAHLEDIRGAYEQALKEHFQDQLTKEFAGLDMKNKEILTKYLEKQAQTAIDAMKERELLVEALNSTQEKSAGKKFKDFWKKHTKLRMAIGAGLTAGAFVAGATGNVPVMALLLGGRMAMSGVGTTLTVEAGWEGVRQKFGKTREMNQKKIEGMSAQQLEEYYAAESVGAADRGLKRNEKVSFFGNKKESKTANKVEDELQARRLQELRAKAQELRDQGKTDEEIMAGSIESILRNENEGHKQLEARTDWLRRNNMKKWVTSVAVGAAMAALVGIRGMNQIKEVLNAKPPVPETPPGSTEPEGPPLPPEAEAPNPETAVPPDAGAGAGAETAPDVSGAGDTVTVEKGDSVWKIIERHLGDKMGDEFKDLPEGQRTHLIDQFKDRVVANPEEFGLKDPDVLTPGQKLDFSSLYEGEAIKEAAEKSAELTQDQIQNIEANNEILRKWVLEHPGERLTSTNVDSIIDQAREVGNAAAETTQNISSAEFADAYTDWLKENPDAAKMNFKDSIMRFAGEHQQAQEVAEAAKNVSPEVQAVYDPVRDWIEQNPGKTLDKETFLKLVNGPTAQEAIEAAKGTPLEAMGSAPKELAGLANLTEAGVGETIQLEAGIKAMKKAGEVTDELIRDGNEKTLKALTEIKLSDVMKGVKTKLEKMEGMSDDMAKKFANAAKELVKHADKSHGTPVNRDWTLGMLSKAVRFVEKAK